jgi:hypothetical protein
MVTPDQVRWMVCKGASELLRDIEEELGDQAPAVRQGLKRLLCDYFSSDGGCLGKLGKTISPVACGIRNANGLKVRWIYPGCGKSGGLRLAVLAYCDERLVKFAGAWRRKTDPSDDDMATAFSDA